MIELQPAENLKALQAWWSTTGSSVNEPLTALVVVKFLLVQQEGRLQTLAQRRRKRCKVPLSSSLPQMKHLQQLQEQKLAALPRVASIKIKDEELDIITLGAIQSLLASPNGLTELVLQNCRVDSKYLGRALLRGLQASGKKSKLERLTIQQCNLSDHIAVHLGKLMLENTGLHHLQALNLSGNPAIGDDAIEALLKPNQLRELRCDDTKVTVETVRLITKAIASGNSSLEHISLLSVDLLLGTQGWESLADAFQDNTNVQSFALGVHDFSCLEDPLLETVLWTRKHFESLQRIQFFLRRNRAIKPHRGICCLSTVLGALFPIRHDADCHQALSISFDWLRHHPQVLDKV